MLPFSCLPNISKKDERGGLIMSRKQYTQQQLASMTPKQLDEAARYDIATELNENIFVEASAGSGKTSSLVLRMVSLVERGGPDGNGVPVNEICTITFTIAAADEFFERFQKLLSIRSGDTPDDSDKYLPRTPETKKRCAEALKNIDSCFLGTMDSFCNMIAHELPAELDIPSNSKIISKEEDERIIKDEYYSILRDNRPENKELHELAKRFNGAFTYPFDYFVAGIKMFRELRHLKVVYDPSILNQDFDTYMGLEKQHLLQAMKDFSDTKINNKDIFKTLSDPEPKLADLNRVKKRNSLRHYYHFLSSNEWDANIQAVFNALKTFKDMGDSFNKKTLETGISQYFNQSGTKYSDTFNQERKNYEHKLENYRYALFITFITKILDRITANMKQEGKFSFYDFLYYLRNAFQKSCAGDKKLIQHITERHKYFLIDESQDTNPMQTELFFFLVGQQKDLNWKNVEPKESSLFIVGDPKQSIYGFRGADVKAYKNVRSVFKAKNEVVLLTQNFRSNARLREWFNTIFNDMLTYTKPAAIEFSLDHPTIPIDPNDPTINVPNKPELLDGEYKFFVKEGQIEEDVAALIQNIKQNYKIYVKNKETGVPEEKPIKYKDFLVIPLKTDAVDYIKTFKKFGIPVMVEAKTPFESSRSLMSCLDVFNALKEPYNPANLIVLLTSPLFALNDVDLIEMKNVGFDFNLANPDILNIQFASPNQQDAINILHNLYLKTEMMGFSSTMLCIINDKQLKLLDKVSSNDLEYTYFIIEKIKTKEEDGTISCLRQFKDYLSDFRSMEKEEQRTLRFKDKVDKVKIANLHKVKGLEAPIVILAKPEKPKTDTTRYTDYDQNPPEIHVAEVKTKNSHGTDITIVKTSLFDSEEEKRQAAQKAEIDRLAYVAATRARNVLIVCDLPDKPDPKNKKAGENPDPFGLKKQIWKELAVRIGNEEDPRIIENPSLLEEEQSEEEDNQNEEVSVENSDSKTSLNPDVTLDDCLKNDKPFETHYSDDSQKDIENRNNCHQKSVKQSSPSLHRLNKVSNKDEVENLNEDPDDLNQTPEIDYEAARKGTIIHRLMECIVPWKDEKTIDLLISKIVDEYNAADYRDLLKAVADKILSGGYHQEKSELPDDILKLLRSADQLEREMPFSYSFKNASDETIIITGTIDVLYTDENGVHVIDYKTGEENDVSSLEKEYEGQLKDYRFAVAKMFNVPINQVTAHIYHIDIK